MLWLISLLITLVAIASAPADYRNNIMLTDLWDRSYSLPDICNGRTSLFFICDPDIASCREGAVYFDSRASKIRERSIQPVCILLASPEEVRNAVLAMGIRVPVYVDSPRRLLGALSIREVLPVMVLTGSKGNVIKTLYGGGESLDHNIAMMLEQERERDYRNLLFVLIPIVAISTILLVID